MTCLHSVSLQISQEQIEAVLKLSGSERLRYFIKMIADREVVWGLYDIGWALASTDEGDSVFPLWPAMEYAKLCAVDEWHRYEPRSIALDDLRTNLLPMLERDVVLPCVFPTPASKGAIPSFDDLTRALDAELRRY